MKNPLQSLLVGFALCLCGLCTWQWYAQVLQQRRLTLLTQTAYDQSLVIQSCTNSLNAVDRQIALMEADLTHFEQSAKTNDVVIAGLRRENTGLSNLVHEFREATEMLQSRFEQAKENLVRQMKSLVAQRDEFAAELNDRIKERNEIVTQYNELVKRVEEIQAAQARAGQSKKPPPK